MVLFFNVQARDAVTAQLRPELAGRQVQVVAEGTNTPLVVREYVPGEPRENWPIVPGSLVTVTSLYSLPTFDTPDGVHVAEAISGGVRVRLESGAGSRIAAEAAEASAAASAASAASAAALAWTQPAPGIMRPPSPTTVFPTKVAALAAASAIGGFREGDMVYIADPGA